MFLSYVQDQDKELFEIFFTFIHIGLRDGELRHLEWDDVDLQKRMIILREKSTLNEKTGEQETWTPKTKNGKREIPIHEKLHQILRARKKRHEDKSNFIFPDSLQGTVGGNLFGGSNAGTALAQHDKDDNIYVAVKYSF